MYMASLERKKGIVKIACWMVRSCNGLRFGRCHHRVIDVGMSSEVELLDGLERTMIETSRMEDGHSSCSTPSVRSRTWSD